MSTDETIIQLVKIALGVVAILIVNHLAEEVIRLLTIISIKP